MIENVHLSNLVLQFSFARQKSKFLEAAEIAFVLAHLLRQSGDIVTSSVFAEHCFHCLWRLPQETINDYTPSSRLREGISLPEIFNEETVEKDFDSARILWRYN